MTRRQELNKLKVAELKEMLCAEGLSVSGKKSELIDRIMNSSPAASAGVGQATALEPGPRSPPTAHSNGGAGGQEVLELSVGETNALRARLGLAPLRTAPPPPPPPEGGNGEDSEDISLSVSETDALRARLGLPPLRTAGGASDGRGSSSALHAPAPNSGTERAARERIEDTRARREVEIGVARLAGAVGAGLGSDGADADAVAGIGDGGEGAAAWASRMRDGPQKTTEGEEAPSNPMKKQDDRKGKKKKGKKKRKKDLTAHRISVPEEDETEYGSSDLRGLAVGHSADDFEAGTTAVLTLADSSVLGGGGGGDEDGPVLENASMRDEGRSRHHLREKRKAEMGAGHAGGYAGYDDDEFEELGGSQAAGRGAGSSGGPGGKGFRIGDDPSRMGREEGGPDLFASESGRAVSLMRPIGGGGGTVQSDFLTHEEANAEDGGRAAKQREKEARKREKRLFKKTKKDKKRSRKQRTGQEDDNDDDDEGRDSGGKGTASGGGIESLLEDLEASAPTFTRDGAVRDRGSRRRKERDADGSEMEGDGDATATAGGDDEEALSTKRRKFDLVMEKGNKRTADAFGTSTGEGDNTTKTSSNFGIDEGDDGDDDAFLNAALSKARRIRKLKEIQSKEDQSGASLPATGVVPSTGAAAAAVAEAVRLANTNGGDGKTAGGISFEFDETREFTRALRARDEQTSRSTARGHINGGIVISQHIRSKEKAKYAKGDNGVMDNQEGGHEFQADIEQLAEQISDDNIDERGQGEGGFDSSAQSKPVGRGLAGVLSMLQSTGEITGKNAGKEELRGRAKDERTYDDYKALDLKKVVKIDAANAKDEEFANREIKLEYRDEHGRLLTRKEAYRQMCYQFHGHGSSKNNEERRLKQIAREQVEAAAGSRHGGQGTMGALKATQSATGKAFVVHKTG